MNKLRFSMIWPAMLVSFSLMGGVHAEDSDGPSAAIDHAADQAFDSASDNSALLREADASDGEADEGTSEGADAAPDEAAATDRQCGEFDTHGAYVSSVAQEDPETDASDAPSHGDVVSDAAQTDIGKCGHTTNEADDEAASGSEANGEASRGISEEMRAEHPPRNE